MPWNSLLLWMWMRFGDGGAIKVPLLKQAVELGARRHLAVARAAV